MSDFIAKLLDFMVSRRKRRTRSWRGPEALEPRALLSLLAGETRVETATTGSQVSAAIASAADDRSVTVWVTNGNISAQRFNASGAKVGTEIRVTATAKLESAPEVAMDDRGYFVVVWVEETSVSDTNLRAQRYDSAGVKRGGVIIVANSAAREFAPNVAVDAVGNFVVTWTIKSKATTDTGVQARRFNDNGTAAGTAFVVANYPTTFESESDVARTPDGRFVITYRVVRFGQSYIVLHRYTAAGAQVGGNLISIGNGNIEPRVSIDSTGNAIVAWEQVENGDSSIRALRVSSLGDNGPIMNVAASVNSEQYPDVAVKRDGTAFVVTYYDPLTSARRLVEMTSTGTVRLRTAISTIANGVSPVRARISITFGSGSNYRLAYEKFPILSITDGNIYQRRGQLS